MWFLDITLNIINFLISASKPMTSVNIATHVINSFYVILNISVTGMPKRILHVWFSVIFALIYALFTVFYYLAGGTNHNGNPYVYPVLDWRKPGSAILYCLPVCFVLVPVVHLILYGIHRLKLFTYEKCDCCKRQTGYQRDSTTVEMKQQYPYWVQVGCHGDEYHWITRNTSGDFIKSFLRSFRWKLSSSDWPLDFKLVSY